MMFLLCYFTRICRFQNIW